MQDLCQCVKVIMDDYEKLSVANDSLKTTDPDYKDRQKVLRDEIAENTVAYAEYTESINKYETDAGFIKLRERFLYDKYEDQAPLYLLEWITVSNNYKEAKNELSKTNPVDPTYTKKIEDVQDSWAVQQEFLTKIGGMPMVSVMETNFFEHCMTLEGILTPAFKSELKSARELALKQLPHANKAIEELNSKKLSEQQKAKKRIEEEARQKKEEEERKKVFDAVKDAETKRKEAEKNKKVEAEALRVAKAEEIERERQRLEDEKKREEESYETSFKPIIDEYKDKIWEHVQAFIKDKTKLDLLTDGTYKLKVEAMYELLGMTRTGEDAVNGGGICKIVAEGLNAIFKEGTPGETITGITYEDIQKITGKANGAYLRTIIKNDIEYKKEDAKSIISKAFLSNMWEKKLVPTKFAPSLKEAIARLNL